LQTLKTAAKSQQVKGERGRSDGCHRRGVSPEKLALRQQPSREASRHRTPPGWFSAIRRCWSAKAPAGAKASRCVGRIVDGAFLEEMQIDELDCALPEDRVHQPGLRDQLRAEDRDRLRMGQAMVASAEEPSEFRPADGVVLPDRVPGLGTLGDE
jgi:hypothetical protein